MTAEGPRPEPGAPSTAPAPESAAPTGVPGPASVPGTAAAGAPATVADGEWLRVHPASPFVRGWVALAAIGFFFGRDVFERALQGRPVLGDEFAGRAPWLLAAGGIMLVIAVLGFVLT